MHIMVNKRYMRKYDTCVGHEAPINKLLLKKPLGIVCTHSAAGAIKASVQFFEVVFEKEKRVRKEEREHN